MDLVQTTNVVDIKKHYIIILYLLHQKIGIFTISRNAAKENRQESETKETIYELKNHTGHSNPDMLSDRHDLILCSAFIGKIAWNKAIDGNNTNALIYMEEMGGLDLRGILGGIE